MREESARVRAPRLLWAGLAVLVLGCGGTTVNSSDLGSNLAPDATSPKETGGVSGVGGASGTGGSTNYSGGTASREDGGPPSHADGGSHTDGGSHADSGRHADSGSHVDSGSHADGSSGPVDAASEACIGPLTELSYTPIADEYLIAETNRTVAQTFTTVGGMILRSVSIPLWTCKANGLVDARLTVAAVRTDGVPDWTKPLGSATVLNVDLRDSCVAGAVFETETFVFPGIPLEAGTRYALVLEAIGSPSGGVYWRRSSTPVDPTNPYPGGAAFEQNYLFDHLDLDFLLQGRSPCGSRDDGGSGPVDAGSDACAGPPTELRYTSTTSDALFAPTNGTLAQSFTTLGGMTLRSVSIPLWTCKANGPVDARLTVAAVRTDGVPDWTKPLGSATVLNEDLKNSCVGGAVSETETFVFSGIPLEAGTQYALVLEGVGAPGGGVYWQCNSDPGNPYPGGIAFDQNSPLDHQDLDFILQGRDRC